MGGGPGVGTGTGRTGSFGSGTCRSKVRGMDSHLVTVNSGAAGDIGITAASEAARRGSHAASDASSSAGISNTLQFGRICRWRINASSSTPLAGLVPVTRKHHA